MPEKQVIAEEEERRQKKLTKEEYDAEKAVQKKLK